MTDAAVTQGTFSDFRLIKGRKVCQIVIEVPIEQADQALAALGGLPQPATEAWVAIARLNGKGETGSINTPLTNGTVWVEGENSYQYQRGEWVPNHAHQSGVIPERPPKDHTKLSFEAAMRCKDPLFQRFLREEYNSEAHGDDDDDTAEAVRRICQIDSRSGLNTDPVAASLWRGLDGRFQAWKRGEVA